MDCCRRAPQCQKQCYSPHCQCVCCQNAAISYHNARSSLQASSVKLPFDSVFVVPERVVSTASPQHKMASVWHNVYSTFIASIRSVGTACTLAAVGVYLHRRNFVVGDGKKTLALIAQQVTIPLFLFSKVVYCNQDWSDQPCPDITEKLDDIWVLLLWPAYVVGWGLVVGYVAATLSGTPNKKAAMAACAFGNSTGMAITLLTAIHSNFPDTTELGAVDPTIFLSVYLLLYPVLQWGVGGSRETLDIFAPLAHHMGIWFLE